jgi:GAF domain-containing protein
VAHVDVLVEPSQGTPEGADRSTTSSGQVRVDRDEIRRQHTMTAESILGSPTEEVDTLLEQFAELSRDLASADTLDATLQRVVDRSAAYVARCHGVSMMFVRRKRLSSPAYSSDVAYAHDIVQYETGEGPCLKALRKEEVVVIDDLEEDPRWPAYREKALGLGVRSTMSFRLFLEDDTLGALNFVSQEPGAFDRRNRHLGQVFAAHAAVAMRAALTDADLHEALDSRDVIGQAKGVLMARELLTSDQAFQRLREISNRENRKLRDVAKTIADTGDVPG